MSQSLKVSDLVRKRAGYEYPGIIVSVFTTRAGAARYVQALLVAAEQSINLRVGPSFPIIASLS